MDKQLSAQEIASGWVSDLGAALEDGNATSAAQLFADTGTWRDHLALSWNLITVEGVQDISQMLAATLESARPRDFRFDGLLSAEGGVIEGWLSFETALGRCTGMLRLRDGQGWTLLTSMRELKGFEEALGRKRPQGTEGLEGPLDSWTERRRREQGELGETVQPFVLIVGGGQGGLALGARLKALGVPALIIDRHKRTGDQWRSRYKSLILHDPVWYDHMPYLPFPATWPVYTPKDKMGDWLEAYAGIMELDVWNDTEMLRADYALGEWSVEVKVGQRTKAIKPKHLVIATGNAGMPRVPLFPGMQSFKGVQHHSSAHPGGEGFKGKRVVVVGGNNSAHDIAADLVAHGASVTMIQRSPTSVWRQETLVKALLAPIYSEEAFNNGITTEMADLLVASIPLRMLPDVETPTAELIMQRDADFYARLEKAGFLLPQGEERLQLMSKYLQAASGYYIDVGASELIADGSIQLRSGVDVDSVNAAGLVLQDGSEVAADAIVYATGYGSMEEWVAQRISPQIAARVGHCWGYGSGQKKDPGPWEGEIRNMWKPTAQPGLWFHGGNLAQARHYSLYLGLQLKARFEKLPIKTYQLPRS